MVSKNPAQTLKYSSGRGGDDKGQINERLAKLNKSIIQETVASQAQGPRNDTKQIHKGKGVASGIEDDDDDELTKIRERRLRAMQEKLHSHLTAAPGSVTELRETEVPNFLQSLKPLEVGIICFYLPELPYCVKMNAILDVIATRHSTNLKMAKINATEAHFWVAKLGVKVLPALVFFRDGDVIGRFVGFEGLGGDRANPLTVATGFHKLKLLPVVFEAADYGVESEEEDSD